MTSTSESWRRHACDAVNTPHLSMKIERLSVSSGARSPAPEWSPGSRDSQGEFFIARSVTARWRVIRSPGGKTPRAALGTRSDVQVCAADTLVMDALDTEDGFSTSESPCPNADHVLIKTPSFGSFDEASLRVSSIGSGSSEVCGARIEWVSPTAQIPRLCVHRGACANHLVVSGDNEEAADAARVVVRSSRRPMPGCALAAQQITRRHVLRPPLPPSATRVWITSYTRASCTKMHATASRSLGARTQQHLGRAAAGRQG